MSPELLDLHRSYADGIIPCDEFAEGLFNITLKGMEWEYDSKYNTIMMVLAWYRDECRSVATSFNSQYTRPNDIMAGYYSRLKEAVDSVVYPNVVGGTQ